MATTQARLQECSSKVRAHKRNHTAPAKHIIYLIIARRFVGKVELRSRIEQQLNHPSVIGI